jgi:outer membrane protein
MGCMSLKAAIAFLTACAAAWSASAQTPSSGPVDRPVKIAVVQFQDAVASTNEFQRELADIQKKFEPRRAELKNLGDEVDQLTKQLDADSSRLTEAERESRARVLDTKKRQAQRVAEDAQTGYEQATQELFNRIAEKLGRQLTKYAADHGYTLVVDRSEEQDQTPVVLWASPSIDITQQVVNAYNARAEAPVQAKPKEPATPSPLPRRQGFTNR